MITTFFKNKAVWLASVCVGLVALCFKCVQHYGIRSHTCDLVFSDQAIWNFVNGNGLYVSLFNVQTFGDHFYPYFFLLVPFYWIKATPLWIFLALALCFAFTAYPIFASIHKRFGLKWMWASAIFLVAYYPFRAGFVQDFHGELLLMPILSWVLYFISEERYRPALYTSLVMLCAKESAIVFILPITLYCFFKSDHKRLSLGILSASVLATVFIMGVFMPFFHTVNTYSHWDKYSELGKTPQDIVWTMLRHPQVFLSKIFSLRTFESMAGMMLPFAFLSMFSPLILLGSGLFLQNFLTDSSILMSRINDHCMLPFVPILFFAFIDRVHFLKQVDLVKFCKRKQVLKRVAVVCVGLNVLLFVFTEARLFVDVSARISAMETIARIIPAHAYVSASDHILPHFHYYDRISNEHGYQHADYVVLEGLNQYYPHDMDAGTYIKKEWNTGSKWRALKALIMGEDRPRRKEDPYVQLFNSVKNGNHFQLVFEQGNLFLFKKKNYPQ